MLRDRTDRAWFSRHLRHPARKRSWSILTTMEPQLARGVLCRTAALTSVRALTGSVKCSGQSRWS